MVAAWWWWEAWPDSLLIIGGAMQMLGVLLLVADVHKAVRSSEEYQPRAQVVEIGHAVDAEIALPIAAVKAEETIESRVNRLDESLRRLQGEMADRDARLGRRIEERAQEAVQQASRAADRRFSALERALLGDTPRDYTRRIWSIALIVVPSGGLMARVESPGRSVRLGDASHRD